MKTLRILLSVLLMLAIALPSDAANDRKTKKKLKKEGLTEVALPLSGPDYSTNREYFRATQMGEGIDITIAKKIATLNARNALAEQIKTQISTLTKSYVQGSAVGTNKSYSAKFEEMTYAIVDEVLEGSYTKDEKAFRKEDGSYRFYVCLEMPKQEFVQKFENTLTKKEEAKLEENIEKFTKEFKQMLLDGK